jgi:DNA repair exonuclease SbcCD nuclease subunit
MKLAIITDTHYGARKGSKHLHDYFELFYKNIFFPSLEAEGIDTIIHMGDIFDSRKSIDYYSLEWAKRVVFEPMKKYKVHAITGNHDCYYKNTNEINSPELLLCDYDNITTYSSAQDINIDGLDILLLPWISTDNFDESLSKIKKSKSKVAMGHLELNGFRAHRGHVMEDGMKIDAFNKFDKVYSGHYHTRSDDGRIFYLGNPYEMFWNDVNDPRGFTLFDTDTLEHTSINNPYKLFYNVYYEDTNHQLFNTTEYENKIVKVIVRKKSSPKEFQKFIDKLYRAGVQDLKIVENFAIVENEDFDIDEDENTISILNRYIDEAEIEFDRGVVKGIFRDLYKQACEVE